MSARWYVVQTKPRAEAWACEQIEAQGFETLLPQAFQRKRIRGVLVEHTVSAFGPYAFVKFDVRSEKWEPIMSTRGVRRLITRFDDLANKRVPRALPDDAARLLIARFADGPLPSLEAAMQAIKAGMVLRVKAGPFENQIGECSWSRSGRVKILFSMLGSDDIEFEEQDVEIAAQGTAA